MRTELNRCTIIERRWNKNTVSLLSSVTSVISLPLLLLLRPGTESVGDAERRGGVRGDSGAPAVT